MRESLPIDDVLPQALEAVRDNNATIIKAAPGAGKTTRLPPAILDTLDPKLPDGKPGQIVVLQPRRVAAKLAAARVADERGGKLGDEVGFQVRHESCSGPNTRILFCTEGTYLRKIQSDPFLSDIAIVIIDEFHERGINSDLALALTKRVLLDVRPDLKIVVMSATLDTEKLQSYLDGCPVIESSGRQYPIDVQYLQFHSDEPLHKQATNGILQLLPKTEGSILTFLPGIGEITRTQELLEEKLPTDIEIAPLHGSMTLGEQQRALRLDSKRKVILSTNIAETSLTINGVTAVVDTGFARVNRFDPQLGLNKLGLERISQASAAQRAGRAGRTAPGICLRLWTERQHASLQQFDEPEIVRVELSESILQLLAWGETHIEDFDWFEVPPETSTARALQMLSTLELMAQNGLTTLGKQAAALPVQPRLARLLLAGEHFGVTRQAALAAALLSERDPFRPLERGQAPAHKSSSDVLDRIEALERFYEVRDTNSDCGRINPSAAKQIESASHQLLKQLGRSSEAKRKQAADGVTDAFLRALTTAFPDRICKRRQAHDRRAIMVGGRGVMLAEESALNETEFFIAVELLDTGKSEWLVKVASATSPEWFPQSLITSAIDVAYDVQRRKVTAIQRRRFLGLVIDEQQAAIPPDFDTAPALSKGIAENIDPSTLVGDKARSYLARLEVLRQNLPELEVPDFGDAPWVALLEEWCTGCSAVSELTDDGLIACIQTKLTSSQLAALEDEVPEAVQVPSGRRIKIEYQQGKPPVLAVRIQEMFGARTTPKLGRGRVPLLLHLLAPNYRVEQITPDLASFWANTYTTVRKELKRRYPKHAWPDDPTVRPPDPKRDKK